MKNILLKILFISLLAFSLNASNFAVLDMNKIIPESKAFKSLDAQVKAYQEKANNELNAKRASLQKEEQSLVSQQDSLSKIEFDKKVEEFQTKLRKVQEDTQAKQAAFERNYNEVVMTITRTINKLASDLAKAQKYDVVYISDALIYYPENKDISAKVLQSLDKALPKVVLKTP